MHADTSLDSEKVGHRRPPKSGASGSRIFPVFHVLLYDLAVSADVVAVQARSMINFLLCNPELPARRIVAFSARRDHGNADYLRAFVEIGSLILKVYLYARTANDPVTVPIRNPIPALLACPEVIRVRSTASQTKDANDENFTKEIRKDLSSLYNRRSVAPRISHWHLKQRGIKAYVSVPESGISLRPTNLS